MLHNCNPVYVGRVPVPLPVILFTSAPLVWALLWALVWARVGSSASLSVNKRG